MARSNVGGMGDYTLETQEENERALVAAIVEAESLYESLQDEADAQRDMVDLLTRQLQQVRRDMANMRATVARHAKRMKKGGR
jgi:DNA anti-recombination protein RmuC